MLASILPAFNGSALNVAIPTIGAEFHSPTADLGWIVTGYTICCLTLALPIGRLADLTSRRTIFIIGTFLLSVSAGSTVLSDSLAMVIFLRLAQGLGSACLFATTIAMVNEVFPPERRGQMLGFTTAAVYIGLAAGPVLGGLFTHYIGWRGIFVFIMGFGIITGVIALVCLPKKRTPLSPVTPPATAGQVAGTKKHVLLNIDPFGILLFACAAIAISLGLNLVPGNIFGWVGLVIGTGSLFAFIRHASRASRPLIPMELFSRGSSFLTSCLSALFNYSATFAVSYLASIYLQRVMSLGADTTGLILIIAPLVQTFVTPVSGRLSDRFSPFRMASLGMGICALGLVSLILLTFTNSMPHLLASLLILGFGFGIFSPANTNAIMSQAPRRHSGVASSFVSTMRNTGQMVSMAVITIIVSLTLGQTVITEATGDSISLVMRLCCIIFLALCVAGTFTSLKRRASQGSTDQKREIQ